MQQKANKLPNQSLHLTANSVVFFKGFIPNQRFGGFSKVCAL